MARTADITRTTNETDVRVRLSLDEPLAEETAISTGIGFLDHMLTAFAMHGGFGLSVHVRGDLEVDGHHTVEDTGIVLGQAFLRALGTREGIARFGSFYVPMDEALAFCAIDVSGRPFLQFDAAFEPAGSGFDYALVEEFFRAFAFNAGITLHARVLYGKNNHHKAEALFKALAHALSDACAQKGGGLLSTKGVL